MDAEISSPQYENQLASYQAMRSQVRGLIENTQAEKTALDEKIKKGRQVLSDYQFTDQASITAYTENCLHLYESYQSADTECRKKSRKVLTGLSFFLAAFSLGAAGYMGITNPSRFLLLMIAAGGASLICLIAGFTFTGQDRRCRRAMEQTSSKLLEILKKHLGDASISEEAMAAFKARMEEFSKLSDMVAKSENAMQKYMEDINSLQEKQNTCSEMIEKQQRTQWELEKKLEHLNSCKNQAAALKRTLAENDRIREEVAAIELAQETMTDLSSSIRDSFGLYLNKEASRLVTGITGGLYNSMSIDENLNVFLNTKAKLVPLENVSSGTMDQVYLALRLAAATLFQNGGEPLPLIFDDSFTQYDDDRLRTALKWLSESYGGQMIVFTCHRREAQMLRAHQIPFHLIEM